MSATNYSTKFLSVIVASSTRKSSTVTVTTKLTFKNNSIVVSKINNRSFTAATSTKSNNLSKTTQALCASGSSNTGTSTCDVGFVSSKSSLAVQVPIRTFYTKKDEDKASNEQQEPYTSLTYPFATEPPEIYLTVAKDLKNHSVTSRTEPYTPPPIKRLNTTSSDSSSSIGSISDISSIFNSLTGATNNNDTSSNVISADGTNGSGNTLQEQLLDPFDDQLTIKDEDVLKILQEQKQSIVTTPPNTTPISLTVPDGIPPLIPSSQLDIPKTQVTTLDNGIRIVSFDSYGSQVSVVGIVAELGSRTEQHINNNRGVTNVLEMLTCQSSTRSYTGQDINDKIQNLGGSNRCSVLGKEQSIIFFDCLRNNLQDAIHILNEVIIHPKFNNDEVNDAKTSLHYNLEILPNDCLLGEGLLQAAYGSKSQMGQNHVVGGSQHNLQSLQQITSTTCTEYWNNQLLNNPYNIVIGGIGVNHEQFVHMIQTQTDFPSLKHNDDNDKRSKIIQSTYIGGDYRYEVPDPAVLLQQQQQSDESETVRESMPITETIEEQNMVKVAVGFEVGGWILPDSNYYSDTNTFGSHGKIIQNNDDLVTLCVLQTLLGGGSSFSVGGPGKGMYSRLYREILNKYNWVDNAECFTSVYNTNGLFGISGTVVHPNYAGDMIMVIVDHILQLTSIHVTDEELFRAKNMLKNSVLSSLESRFILFEDISKQMLMYGRHDNIQDTITKIQMVSPEDIRQFVINSITINSNHRPTVASVGRDISSVPQYDLIQSWFQNIKQ